jgi:KamA family protein
MIPTTVRRKNVPAWQRALSSAISDPEELASLLDIDPAFIRNRVTAAQRFPLRVPRAYVERMQRGAPDDPLLLQVLPRSAEDTDAAGFVPDPVGDRSSMPRPGLLHKYHGRVLLVTTGACGIHCRYCFRRHFPYAEANPRTDQWSEALAYIGADASIREVILSGGDPLSLPDTALAALVAKLDAIEHVETLCVHTRMPVVLPERVDEALTGWVAGAPELRVRAPCQPPSGDRFPCRGGRTPAAGYGRDSAQPVRTAARRE